MPEILVQINNSSFQKVEANFSDSAAIVAQRIAQANNVSPSAVTLIDHGKVISGDDHLSHQGRPYILHANF
jgi:hypothetical protein